MKDEKKKTNCIYMYIYVSNEVVAPRMVHECVQLSRVHLCAVHIIILHMYKIGLVDALQALGVRVNAQKMFKYICVGLREGQIIKNKQKRGIKLLNRGRQIDQPTKKKL